MTLRFTTAAASVYDRVAAHVRLLETAEVDVVLLSFLDNTLLRRLALERERDAESGYVPGVAAAMHLVAPRLFLEPGLRVITDGGGLHPRACATAIARVLADAGSGELAVGIVRGDDLRDSLEELYSSGCPLEHRETGAPFADLKRPILAAYAELGARGISQALAGGGRVIVTGVTAPSSVAVAAAAGEFRWAWDDWEHLAAAAAAGTLLRQGAHLACGDACEGLAHIIDPGPPIVEIGPQGQVTLNKIPAADGTITPEKLMTALAATANPARFLTPDVEVDFTSVQAAARPDRQDVLLWGVTGRPAPAAYNATLWFHDGYTSTAHLWLDRADASYPAEQWADFLAERVRRGGHSLESMEWWVPREADGELGGERPAAGFLRLTASSLDRAAVEQFADEVAALSRSVPHNVRPIGDQRPSVEPLVRAWPTLVPRELVQPVVEVRPTREWL